MDISLYLTTLRDHLAEEEIGNSEIEKILNRENAILSGASEQALHGLLTFERLDIIVASTVKRYKKNTGNENFTEAPIPELGSTGPITSKYAVQDSPSTDDTATITHTVTVSADRSVLRFTPEATNPIKTVSSESGTVRISTQDFDEGATVTLSPSETATVPIQIRSVKKNEESDKPQEHFSLSSTTTVVISDQQQEDATKTVEVSPEIQKLMSETQTVRISELDTVSFDAVAKDNDGGPSRRYQTVKIPNTPVTVSEEATVRLPVTVSQAAESSDTVVNVDNLVQETVNDTVKVKNDNVTRKNPSEKLVTPAEKASVTKADLRNPQPLRSLALLVLLFLPTICFVGTAIVLVFIAGNLLLTVGFALISFLFLGLCVIPLLVGVYSLVFGIVYLFHGEPLAGLGELGVFLIGISLSSIFYLLLYKPYMNMIERLVKCYTVFNRKILLLIQNLFRYTVKGVDRI